MAPTVAAVSAIADVAYFLDTHAFVAEPVMLPPRLLLTFLKWWHSNVRGIPIVAGVFSAADVPFFVVVVPAVANFPTLQLSLLLLAFLLMLASLLLLVVSL